MESEDIGPGSPPAGAPAPAGPVDGRSRWERSFSEHARRDRMPPRMPWVIGGVVAVIILTFILGALL